MFPAVLFCIFYLFRIDLDGLDMFAHLGEIDRLAADAAADVGDRPAFQAGGPVSGDRLRRRKTDAVFVSCHFFLKNFPAGHEYLK